MSIVGIGPGALDQLSRRAYDVIRDAQVIVGYRTYIKLLGRLIAGKEIVSFGMKREIQRVRLAIRKAREGKRVCLVSSGDPGVYGMAGPALEVDAQEGNGRKIASSFDLRSGRSLEHSRRALSSGRDRGTLCNDDRGCNDGDRDDVLDIEIIPGISSATACAALLGAPLSHDFAVISLSDLLTDRRVIEKRLRLAAQADFVIVLYNPRSVKRRALLEKAWRIIAEYRSGAVPVGIVRNAYRAGEEVRVTCMKDAPGCGDIDMVTTVIVGNSRTYVRNGCMITPRGYGISPLPGPPHKGEGIKRNKRNRKRTKE